VSDLHTGYSTGEIVHGISFEVAQNSFVCIIGANGCGKTTALRAILGLLPATGGEVRINGKPTRRMSPRELARHFAYIPQVHRPPFPFRVADVVLMGRTPYLSSVAGNPSSTDKTIAWQAIQQLSIEHLADSEYTQLSGGQQQLVLIARALAQQPSILIMDEPTASLDFGNQQLVLTRMHRLARSGMAVLMVTHDPDHALFCADEVQIMEDGLIIQSGPPAEVITTESLQRIYHARVYVADVEVEPGLCMRTCIPLMEVD
jgi:iron complex transport system ATP-binding protein